MEISSKPHIVLLSSSGLGHLIPVIELAKRLATHHSVTVTVFSVTADSLPADSCLLESAAFSGLFQAKSLQRPALAFSPDTDVVTCLVSMTHASLPSLHSEIANITPRPCALVVDLFSTEAMKVADEFHMLKYVFFASNAWFLAFTVLSPQLETVSPDVPLEIPGCSPVPVGGLSSNICDQDSQHCHDYKRIAAEITTADGILVNTWYGLEHRTLDSFKSEEFMKPIAKAPVRAIGPVVRRSGVSSTPKCGLLEWLDKQPVESVLYVSFGSGGTLTTKQTNEMAWGLENSQQRFVWVLRAPRDHDATASLYLNQSTGDEIVSRYLPEGFLDRTRGVGMIVPTWAPQEEILAHPAVGGFLSHCGWNSTLESLVNGVPLIGWPLYAEQDMNAMLLALDLKVAVRPNAMPSKETVGREEIERMIREIMMSSREEEGVGNYRSHAKELRVNGERALTKGGTSYEALSEFVEECEMGRVSTRGL